MPVLLVPRGVCTLARDSGAISPTFFLFKDQPRLSSPHLIALHFIKRGVMSVQLLISKEFLPPGKGSLSSGSETHFFPSLINFLLLLWQPWFSISLGSTPLQNWRAFWLVGVRSLSKDLLHGGRGVGENSFSWLHPLPRRMGMTDSGCPSGY